MEKPGFSIGLFEIPEHKEAFHKILSVVVNLSGVDFKRYKQTTLTRRVLKRMSTLRLMQPIDYLQYLAAHPAEQQALYGELLIHVTGFFRDPKSFDALCGDIITKIIESKQDHEPIRIWIAGCATGEEVYSIAICLREHYGDNAILDRFKIFATDLSENSIAKARRGVYNEREIKGISEQRLERFFLPHEEGHIISAPIREMCVFAVHNMLADPPFVRLDLVSCRNVLIYLQPALQRKVLSTFHYSLNEGSYLFLGRSETNNLPDLFELYNKEAKVYRKKQTRGRNFQHQFPTKTVLRDMKTSGNSERGNKEDFQKEADGILLSQFTPCGVVVNEQWEVVDFRGSTGVFLEPAPGKASFNVLKMARKGLSYELRVALNKAKSERLPVRKEGVELMLGNHLMLVQIDVIPLQQASELHFLIVFRDTTVTPYTELERPAFSTTTLSGDAKDARIAQLERELAQSREELRSIAEEQEAANEELQSANEELRALNEELETSQEELQCTNDELVIRNKDITDRYDQLNRAKAYAESIINTVHEPLIVLNGELKVVSANDTFYATYQIPKEETEGALLFSLGNNQWNILELRNLLENIPADDAELATIEITHRFEAIGERVLRLNARRVRGIAEQDYILLAIEDVTSLRKMIQKLQRHQRLLQVNEERQRLAIQSTRAGTWDYHPLSGKVIWSERAKELFGISNGTRITYPMFRSLLHPEDRLKVEASIKAVLEGKHSGTFDMVVRVISAEDGRERRLLGQGQVSFNQEGKAERFVGVIQDITAEAILREEQQKMASLVENSTDYMGITSGDGQVLYLNQAGRKLVGIAPSQDIKQLRSDEFYAAAEYTRFRADILPTLEAEGRYSGPLKLRHFETGEEIPCHADLMFIVDPITGQRIGRAATVRDLRGAIKTQEALVESEKRFRSIIEQSPVSIGLLKGTDMVIEAANVPILQVWGKEAAVIGMPLVKALPELEGQGFMELLQQVYETGEAYYGYETLATIHEKSTYRDKYFNFVYAPVREGDGAVSGIVVVATEVTEQVESRKRLEESEARFRTLVLNANVATAVYKGEDLIIETANEAMIKLWGKDASVIGKPLAEALPELEDQPFLGLLHTVYHTGQPYLADEDKVNLMIDGQLQSGYFNFSYKPLTDDAGKPYAILNMAVDVSKVVQSRENLKEAEEQLRIAVGAARLGTWMTNLLTGEVVFSERLANLFGFEDTNVTLEQAFNAIHEEDREHTRQLFDAAMNPDSNGHYDDEYRVFSTKDGRTRILRAVGRTFFNAEGKAYLMVGSVMNVTKQRLNEKELNQLVQQRTEELELVNDALQKSNQELEQYAYIASHDLQEPLRKIRTFTDLLLNKQFLHYEDSRTYLSRINSSAIRMATLIRDLLDYSRVSSDTDLFTETNLNKVVTSVLQDYDLLIQERNCEVTVGKLPVISAIPLQMNQLFYNLVGNALKFSRKDITPIISITAERLQPEELGKIGGLNPHGSYQKITVRDNGIGFNQDFAEKIFVIFQRLNSKGDYEGTGIGLALCRKIVDNHNGIIYAEGSEEGAAFHIILPAQ